MKIHVVQSGDTLWRIAQNYGTSMNQIIVANGLDDPNRMVLGEALVIPNPFQQYVVQRGDTLWQIANRYGVSIQEIIAPNQLTDASRLYIGQVLTIPVIYHTIQPGETLWSIANHYGTTISAIVQANQIQNPGMIHVGQRLRIPEAPKKTIEVNAYITDMGQAGANIVTPLTPSFTYVTPFSHRVNEDGSLTALNDDLIISAARNRNVSPLLVLTNFVDSKFDSDRVKACFKKCRYSKYTY